MIMMKNLLTPPVFEDAEKTVTARLLYVILAIDVAICFVFLIPFYYFAPERLGRYLVLATIVLITSGLSLYATRKGHTRIASIILVASLWASIMIAALTSGGVEASIYIGSAVLIVMAGMLLGDRAAIVTAIASIVAGAIMIILESVGILPAFPKDNNVTRLLVYTFFFSLTMIFQRMSTRAMREALNNARIELQERQRTEQALRDSEERYRLISSVSSDYMFSTQLGPDGNLQLDWVAGAFERITGYTYEEYVARGGWISALHSDDREKDARDMAVLQTNQPVTSEVRITNKNGDLLWVRVYAQPRWDNENNRLSGIYGAVQEITSQKKAEEELEQHAEEMYILYQMGVVLTTGQDMYQTLRKLLDHLRHLFVLDTFFVGVYDNETGMISYPLYENFTEPLHVPSRNLHENPGISGEVIFKQSTVYIPDMDAPGAQKTHAAIIVGTTHTRSFLGVPIITHDRVIGLVSVQSQQPNTYNERQIRLLETIAAQIGTALEKASLVEKLQQELIDRKHAEDEVRKLNIELEQRVHERTIELSASEGSLRERSIQLEATNKELEAFAYSVSHDLRAPLRAIKGFSQILLADFAAKLDGEGLDFLQRISQAASQMSDLIESLLSLSRLTRGELNRKYVNLTMLARDILERMNQQEPERPVTWVIAEGLQAYVDEKLFRTVLENLLGNAWKYTSKTENPTIEMGSMIKDDQTVYFVRDNGVGFDMENASKLFGAFQRLHTDSEFPGHGIGLATIQRIIHRHGGVIWAEAEPGKGATLYFSLDEEV
jgi:PAS domain S-box-containing protein